MNVLLLSSDPAVREIMALTVRSAERSVGEPFELIEAADGLQGIRLAWRHKPEIVVADEIMSGAGAFAVTRDLKGAGRPFPGRVVILLERIQDAWLAAWAGADAWFVKPVNPFELAETVAGFLGEPKEEAV